MFRLPVVEFHAWRLVAHEAVHVVQYGRGGFVPFLVLYLGQYFGGLRSGRRALRARHGAAYLAIALEREEWAAEAAYETWRTSALARDS